MCSVEGGIQLIPSEMLYVDVARVELEGRVNKTKETMSAWLEEAKGKAPCLLVLDGLDMLLMPEQEVSPASTALSQIMKHVPESLFFGASPPVLMTQLNTSTSSNNATLADHFAQLFARPPPGVLVLATALSAQSLHPLLNTKHVFGETVKIPPATKEIRAKVRVVPLGIPRSWADLPRHCISS